MQEASPLGKVDPALEAQLQAEFETEMASIGLQMPKAPPDPATRWIIIICPQQLARDTTIDVQEIAAEDVKEDHVVLGEPKAFDGTPTGTVWVKVDVADEDRTVEKRVAYVWHVRKVTSSGSETYTDESDSALNARAAALDYILGQDPDNPTPNIVVTNDIELT